MALYAQCVHKWLNKDKATKLFQVFLFHTEGHLISAEVLYISGMWLLEV